MKKRQRLKIQKKAEQEKISDAPVKAAELTRKSDFAKLFADGLEFLSTLPKSSNNSSRQIDPKGELSVSILNRYHDEMLDKLEQRNSKTYRSE